MFISTFINHNFSLNVTEVNVGNTIQSGLFFHLKVLDI
jgi:hypothetical protein